ncbi:phosphotransferase [Marinobacter hydrocarbonoclasticus]|nr:phosphotransferase [Marinobacter nauticus]
MRERLNLALSTLREAGFEWHGMTPLTGGLGNRLWRLSGHQEWVLRLHNADLDFCVDRQVEARAWDACAAIDRAPRRLFWTAGFSLAQWGGAAPSPIDEAALLDLMVDLHHINGDWPEVDPASRIVAYLDEGASVLAPYLHRLNELTERLNRSALPKGFCHGDLHAGNLVVDEAGRWRALDFEYAGRASPLMDLAHWLSEAANPEALWRHYLSQRQVSPGPEEWSAAQAAVSLYLMMCVAWCERMIRSGGDPIYSQWRNHYFEQMGAWLP